MLESSPQYYSPPTGLEQLWREIVKILEYLMSPELHSILNDIKIFFIGAILFFSFSLLFFLISSSYFDWHLEGVKYFLGFKKFFNRKVWRRWQKVKKLLESSRMEPEWKLAVVEAMEIFDNNLQQMEYKGDNFKERVSSLNPDDVSDLDKLIKMSEICQDMIRDPEYHLSKHQAQEIVEAFEKALEDLGVL